MNEAGLGPKGVERAQPSHKTWCLVSYQGFALGFPIVVENPDNEVCIQGRVASCQQRFELALVNV
jgi:hypothetical protein